MFGKRNNPHGGRVGRLIWLTLLLFIPVGVVIVMAIDFVNFVIPSFFVR